MSLVRKFLILLLSSIFIIVVVNILAFYVFYWSYLKIYLAEKIESRDKITLDYVNWIIQKQTADDVDNIFSDTELEFFELLENNKWQIPLNKQENIDIVINYLIKNWVTPKYIEKIIPTDNFWKVLNSLKDKKSPEYKFITKLTISILFTNIIAIFFIAIIIFVFTRKIVLPIKDVTDKIKVIEIWKDVWEIKYYNKKDEVWLLINAINWLNQKIKLQDDIKNRLMADISHELKTPITSIQCYLEWILDWVIKLNSKNLTSITEEMGRLINLVNKIMDYEKFENKDLILNLTKENVWDIIKKIVETHKKKLKENKQMIKVVWDEYLEINLDKSLFKQVVHNLIWNFMKYSWKRTLLTINITKKFIDFSDNWSWIKKSEIPFITEKFYQWNIEKTGDIENRWIWIWLSIIKKIIETHNWKVEIKSDIWKWFSFKIKI